MITRVMCHMCKYGRNNTSSNNKKLKVFAKVELKRHHLQSCEHTLCGENTRSIDTQKFEHLWQISGSERLPTKFPGNTSGDSQAVCRKSTSVTFVLSLCSNISVPMVKEKDLLNYFNEYGL